MASKDIMFTLRLPKKMLEEYRKFCSENAINMSARLRKFMDRDLELWRQKQAASARQNEKGAE
jgi:hypothetical protein